MLTRSHHNENTNCDPKIKRACWRNNIETRGKRMAAYGNQECTPNVGITTTI